MKKYEYLVLEFKTTDSQKTLEATTAALTEKGKEGWELVSVSPIEDYNGEHSLFYFKRPLPN